jgi:uncharacterized cupredoxin-like copper-binding protein
MFAAGLLLTACGAQGNSNEVTITLTEFGIETSRDSFETGVPYHFVVTNAGAINHEFMIMPPLTEDQMMMGMDMEAMDEMALAMIEDDELTPETTQTFDYTFTEPAPTGTLEFTCHVEGHYEAGMKFPITVK